MSIAEVITKVKNAIKFPFTAARVGLLAFIFLTGCISIVFSQFLFLTFHFFGDQNAIQRRINYTKKNFVILLTFCSSMFTSPTKIILSFRSKELRERYMQVKPNGTGNQKFQLTFEQSAVIISNHQIYSDWFFIWFLAYLNDCSDHFFIVMKKSLKRIPILGNGMTNYNFVFLSRNWEQDKNYMIEQFNTIKTISNKFWMLIFPEGTNMSLGNVVKSHNFATKNDLPKQDCVLLPRVKGLYVACKELAPNTTKIIDFTVGYSEHSKEEMAQDVFTLWRIYILGESPQHVSILVDEFDLEKELPTIDWSGSQNSIPLEQEEKELDTMNTWINNKWQVKEKDMEYYYKTGQFKESEEEQFEIDLKLNSTWEIINVYLPSLSVVPVIGGLWALAKYLI